MSAQEVEKIAELKRRLNAVILAHNYQRDEVQAVADFTGDSLELARKAVSIDADVVVFCGVRFMAESAAVLNPGKMVLFPDETAGCPLADMIDVPALQQAKAANPEAAVVCYINSSAAVKAESDICCTSSNAAAVVGSLSAEKVLFVPDRNLACWVAGKTGKTIIPWDGYCPTHERLTVEELLQAKAEHPSAEVLVHPECDQLVTSAADFVLSTGSMLRWARESEARQFIVGTEVGLLYRLRRENPGKLFISPSPRLLCPNMKKITLDKIVSAMEEQKYVVTVEPTIANRARLVLDAMLSVAV